MSNNFLLGTGIYIKAPGNKDGKSFYRQDSTRNEIFIMFDRETFTWRVSRYRILIFYDELLILRTTFLIDYLSDHRF